MSAKIKVSYEYHPELLALITQLGKMVDKVRQQPPKGRYRLAYIELKPLQRMDKPGIMER